MVAQAGPRRATRLAVFAAMAMIGSGTNLAIAAEKMGSQAAGSQASAPELIVPNGHSGSIAAAAYSADGKWVVTVGSNHTAIVWDAASGRKLWQVDSPEDCAAVAFSPDGRWLAFGGGKGSVVVWDVRNRAKKRTIPAHVGGVTCVAFDKVGSRLLTASKDCSAAAWDCASGRKIQEFNTSSPATAALFTPDGSNVVTASDDGAVLVWDAANGKKTRTLHAPAPDVAERSGPNEEAFRSKSAHSSLRLAIRSDGRRLAAGPFDRATFVWNLQSGAKLDDPREDWERSVNFPSNDVRLAWRSDGQQSVVVSGTSHRWEPAAALLLDRSGATAAGLGNHLEVPLAFSRDGTKIAVRGENDMAVFEAKPHPHTVPLPIRQTYFPPNLATFSRDGKLVAASGWTWVRAWDIGQRLLIAVYDSRTTAPLEFSPNGKRLLVGDRGVRFLDIEKNGATLQILPGSLPAFSPDGKQLVLVDRKIALYDAATLNKLRTFEQRAQPVYVSPTFSPDGKLMAATDVFGVVVLWDVQTGRKLHEFRGFPAEIVVRAFNHDTAALAVAAPDFGSLHWTAAGEKIVSSVDQNVAISCYWFSPDGSLVANACKDGSVVYWDTRTGEKLLTLLIADTRDWIAATPSGLFDCSEEGRKLFSFHTGPGIEATSAEQLAGKFYRAGLLDSVLSGKRPK